MSLRAGQPLWGPAGLDAGSVLQQAVIFGQFGVTSSRQPIEEKQGEDASDKHSHQVLNSVTYPKRKA